MSQSVYVRTCQECGHKQVAKDPMSYATGSENWRNLVCKHCKSNSLDYGSDGYTLVDGEIVRNIAEEDSEY